MYTTCICVEQDVILCVLIVLQVLYLYGVQMSLSVCVQTRSIEKFQKQNLEGMAKFALNLIHECGGKIEVWQAILTVFIF